VEAEQRQGARTEHERRNPTGSASQFICDAVPLAGARGVWYIVK
jgi:hypothetical protein